VAEQELRWRRGFPARALRRLGWFAIAGAGVVAATSLLFGGEPDRLTSGERNLLAMVPRATIVLAAAAMIPPLVATVRRPIVAADHYALTIRPGALRRLILPWAGIAEIAGRVVVGAPLLLVRCGGAAPGRIGDRPRWYDRGVLRRAGRGAAVGYDLAVRMDEFGASPGDRFTALAAWAPRHVLVVDDLGAGELDGDQLS
jgi:hypothetical protein